MDTVKARAMTPIMREEIDWIFIFAEPSREKRQHLYDRFIPDRYPFDAFCEYMDIYTKKDGCLVVDMLKDIITVPIDK
jgi:HEPN domain-containing protein